jgi:hypothetical protein
MPIELRETPSAESAKTSWSQVMMALQPIIHKSLPQDDKDYFNGILNFLIGKEPRISNIDKKIMFLYIRKGRIITKLFYNRQIWDMNYIRRKLIEYLNELALSLGEDGLFIKYGIGGYSRQFVEQKMISENIEQKKKGWLG